MFTQLGPSQVVLIEFHHGAQMEVRTRSEDSGTEAEEGHGMTEEVKVRDGVDCGGHTLKDSPQTLQAACLPSPAIQEAEFKGDAFLHSGLWELQLIPEPCGGLRTLLPT